MFEEIKRCVYARINFFDEYYTIPQGIQSEVDTFIGETVSLGNSCHSAAVFEENFVSTGLSDKFNAILLKCIPKPMKTTKEQKQQSRKIAKKIIVENKAGLIKDVLTDIGDRTITRAKDELIKKTGRE